MTPQPIPNRPSQFQIDNQWLEFYEPALKYGAKIDASQVIGDSTINIEDSGLPFGSFRTLDFVAFTLVDNGDGSVSIQAGPGSGVILQENGTPLSASPFVTLNFVGATLTDDGGAVSTITIAATGSTINWATVNWTNFFNDVDWSDFTDWSTFVTSLTTNWTATDWNTFTSTFTSNLSSTEVIDILDQAPGSTDNDVFLWDNTAGEWTIGPIPGGGGGSGISESVTQVAHGFIVGDVIKSAGTDNVFAKAQANSEVNAEVLGIVTAVADVDNFTYAKDLVGYAGAGIPAGTPGEAVWLSPTVAGAMTTTKPTAVGQVQKPLGQITASGTAMNFTADMRGELITSATPGATGGLYVGVGTIQQEYFNTELPFGLVDPSDGTDMWSIANISVLTPWKITFNNDGRCELDISSFPVLNKQIILQFLAVINTSTAPSGDASWLGFAETILNQGTNGQSICFIFGTDGTMYTRTGTASGFTENVITQPTNNVIASYRIEADFENGEARFYIDGVLVDTITTTIPTLVDNILIGNGGFNGEFVETVYTPTISTKL